MGLRALVSVCAALCLAACADDAGGPAADGGQGATRDAEQDAGAERDRLRLDQIQVLATHNSYHVETPGTTVPEWKQTALPLAEQLDLGVRGVELDTHFDEPTREILVHHVPTLDQGTTCETLRACLELIDAWSKQHPRHHVLFIHLEPKDADVGQTPDWSDYTVALQETFLDVFGDDRIVKPSEVRGDFDTLREAVMARGFPTVEETRGKVLVYIDERGPFHDAYTLGGTEIEGVMFPSSQVDEPIAGVVISNDPQDPATRTAVEAGFLVRTRADSVPVGDDLEATRDAALASGAQIVTTDFPAAVGGVSAFAIPGGTPSRCNPLTAPASCVAQDVEDPATLDAAP